MAAPSIQKLTKVRLWRPNNLRFLKSKKIDAWSCSKDLRTILRGRSQRGQHCKTSRRNSFRSVHSSHLLPNTDRVSAWFLWKIRSCQWRGWRKATNSVWWWTRLRREDTHNRYQIGILSSNATRRGLRRSPPRQIGNVVIPNGTQSTRHQYCQWTSNSSIKHRLSKSSMATRYKA